MATTEKTHTATTLDPTRTLNAGDPGDQTLRNFRYQLLYGVILLAAASAGSRPYVAVWCEHYEDFLCERDDGRFDGIQVKTRQPESGFWKITDEPFIKTIGRFVDLNRQLGPKAVAFHFVSNARCDELTPENGDQRRRGRCPKHILEHVRLAASPSTISEPFKTVFGKISSRVRVQHGRVVFRFKKSRHRSWTVPGGHRRFRVK